MEKRVKLTDIAREAGVSVTAVSFYINGKAKKYKLSEATCRRIASVVEKYDFVPNIFARAMQQNRTYLIGVLVRGRINTSFWSDIVAGIEAGVAPFRYHLVLSSAHSDAAGELEALKSLRSKGVDAYVISPVCDDSGRVLNLDYLSALSRRSPVIGMNLPMEGISSVYNDDFAGGRAAAEYLYRKGHRRVAVLCCEEVLWFGRFRAFREYYAGKGCPVTIWTEGDALLGARPLPSAVFCFSDYLAAGLCSRAAAAGIRVPQELSVLGYDHLEPLVLMTPSIASVNQHKGELGARIAERLMAVLENGEPNRCRDDVFLPEVVSGDSVADLGATGGDGAPGAVV